MSDPQSHTPAAPHPAPQEEITVGKTVIFMQDGKEATVFTMTLGGETISLLPLRNWSQLDVYKWRARGKVPGTPAGLEITGDHVKVASEVVSTQDPEGPAKLEKLLNEWLAFARRTMQLAHKEAHPQPTPVGPETDVSPDGLAPLFRVQVDKEGQVHIHCLHGKKTLATIGLNLPGLNSLIGQGLMHRPRAMQVGALHDWIELDGKLFHFAKGQNDAAKLEKVLNDRYISTAALGQGREVVVFANAASPTGFDIQFTARVGGAIDHRRRPLNEQSLELLQDRDHCGLLPKDMVIKLSPPNFIFKRKTPDGGERYLEEGPESIVTVTGDAGEITMVDLSRPVNYSRLTALELTAVFNHPAVNQHSRTSTERGGSSQKPSPARIAVPPRAEPPPPSSSPPPTPPPPATKPQSNIEIIPAPTSDIRPGQPPDPAKPADAKPEAAAATPATPAPESLPNLWLKEILGHAAPRHEWFNWLVYRMMAEHFGNSSEGYFGPIPCWASSLGDVDDICDPGFRGIFLTKKGGLGYLNQGRIARFCHEVAFVGTLESTIEGIGVPLVAVGADSQCRIVFIVTEGYRGQFGVPEHIVAEELEHLRNHDALVLSVNEVLHSLDQVEVVWTVPSQQANPSDPRSVEHLRPGKANAQEAPIEPPAEGDGLTGSPPG
ncbi:MAG TPA: hypothetical protein PKI20_14720 [Verrucomicrobiota bacterium]|nr:hypothetical protein [Verrucomicrobiota bacterium]